MPTPRKHVPHPHRGAFPACGHLSCWKSGCGWCVAYSPAGSPLNVPRHHRRRRHPVRAGLADSRDPRAHLLFSIGGLVVCGVAVWIGVATGQYAKNPIGSGLMTLLGFLLTGWELGLWLSRRKGG